MIPAVRGGLPNPRSCGYQREAFGIIEFQVEGSGRTYTQVRIPTASLPHVQHVVAYVGDDIPLVCKAEAESLAHGVRGGRTTWIQPLLWSPASISS